MTNTPPTDTRQSDTLHPLPRTVLLRRRADLAELLLELLAADVGGPYSSTETHTLEGACEALISALCAAEHNRPPSGSDARRIRRVIDAAQATPGSGEGWLDLLIGHLMTTEETRPRPTATSMATTLPRPLRDDPLHAAATEALLIAEHVDSHTRRALTSGATTLITRAFNTDRETARLITDRAQYVLRHAPGPDWLRDAAEFIVESTRPPMPDASLGWTATGTGDWRDQHAPSRHVLPYAASARYEIGLGFHSGPDDEGWCVALAQLDAAGQEVGRAGLGTFDDEDTAKRRALACERGGRPARR